jgi:hypothetical protein
MAIHQMDDAQLDKFADFVRLAGYSLSSMISKLQALEYTQ